MRLAVSRGPSLTCVFCVCIYIYIYSPRVVAYWDPSSCIMAAAAAAAAIDNDDSSPIVDEKTDTGVVVSFPQRLASPPVGSFSPSRRKDNASLFGYGIRACERRRRHFWHPTVPQRLGDVAQLQQQLAQSLSKALEKHRMEQQQQPS